MDDDDDTRTADVKQFDATMDVLVAIAHRLDKLVAEDRTRQTQTVIHKTGDSSGLLIGAIVACFATWVAVVLIFMQLHDLTAWRDIHQNHINALEAKIK